LSEKALKWSIAAPGAAVAAAFAMAIAPAIASETVKIGVLTDFNGPYSAMSGAGSVRAVEMAVKDFGSTVLGKPAEIVTADQQGKSDIAVATARNWYDHDVEIIVDLSNSPVARRSRGSRAKKKRIAIRTTASVDKLTNESCLPYGAHWVYDSYAFGKIAATSAEPGSTWLHHTRTMPADRLWKGQ